MTDPWEVVSESESKELVGDDTWTVSDESPFNSKEYAASFFADNGWEPHHVSGIVGNLYHESEGLQPYITEKGDSKSGFGLAQWSSPDRKRGLFEYAKSKGETVPSFQTQLEYVNKELSSPESEAGKALRSTKTVDEATKVFSERYERPGKPMMSSRLKHARDIASSIFGISDAYAAEIPKQGDDPWEVVDESPLDASASTGTADGGDPWEVVEEIDTTKADTSMIQPGLPEADWVNNPSGFEPEVAALGRSIQKTPHTMKEALAGTLAMGGTVSSGIAESSIPSREEGSRRLAEADAKDQEFLAKRGDLSSAIPGTTVSPEESITSLAMKNIPKPGAVEDIKKDTEEYAKIAETERKAIEEINKTKPKDLQGKLWDNPYLAAKPAWWIENIVDTSVSMVPSIASYAAGGKLAGGVVGGGMEGANFHTELLSDKENEVDPDTAAKAAIAYGIASGVLNTLGLESMFGGKAAVKKGALEVAKRFARGAFGEGVTEYSEEPTQAVIESLARGDSPEQAAARLAESLKNVEVGVFAGLMGGGTAAVSGKSGPRTSETTEGPTGTTPLPGIPTPDAIGTIEADLGIQDEDVTSAPTPSPGESVEKPSRFSRTPLESFGDIEVERDYLVALSKIDQSPEAKEYIAQRTEEMRDVAGRIAGAGLAGMRVKGQENVKAAEEQAVEDQYQAARERVMKPPTVPEPEVPLEKKVEGLQPEQIFGGQESSKPVVRRPAGPPFQAIQAPKTLPDVSVKREGYEQTLPAIGENEKSMLQQALDEAESFEGPQLKVVAGEQGRPEYSRMKSAGPSWYRGEGYDRGHVVGALKTALGIDIQPGQQAKPLTEKQAETVKQILDAKRGEWRELYGEEALKGKVVKPQPGTAASNLTDQHLVNDETMGQIEQRILGGNTGIREELGKILATRIGVEGNKSGMETFQDWMNPAKIGGRIHSELMKAGMPSKDARTRLSSLMKDYEWKYNKVIENHRKKEGPNAEKPTATTTKALSDKAAPVPDATRRVSVDSVTRLDGERKTLSKRLGKKAVDSITAQTDGFTDNQRDIEQVAKLFGTDIVWFSATDPSINLLDGFVSDDRKTAFIRTDAVQPLLYLVGHESLHAVQERAPKLYDELIKVLKEEDAYSQDYIESVMEAYDEVGIERPDADGLFDEFAAHIAGHEFQNPKFWKMFNERNPSLAQKIARVVDRILDRILKYFGIHQTENPYVKDVERVRKVLVDVFGDFARAEGVGVDVEKGDVPFSISRPPMDRVAKKIMSNAKKEFGVTYDYREAGYILPSGEMLDFSGKNQGGQKGTRSFDHRDVNRVIPDELLGKEEYSTGMRVFMEKTGSVRFSYIGGDVIIDFASPPTPSQMRVISTAIKQGSGAVAVDVTKKDGTAIASEYMEIGRPSKVRQILDDAFAKMDKGSSPDSVKVQFSFAGPKAKGWKKSEGKFSALSPGGGKAVTGIPLESFPKMPSKGKKYPLAPSSEWWANSDYKAKGGVIVETTPDAFLRSVRKIEIDEASRDAIDELKDLIQSGQKLTPAEVWLTNGEIKPKDHDGRHRAVAAKELGITRFPVLVINNDMTPVDTIPASLSPQTIQRATGEYVAQKDVDQSLVDQLKKDLEERKRKALDSIKNESGRAVIIEDLANLGVRYIEQGANTFGKFHARMKESLGSAFEKVRTFMRQAFNRAMEIYKGSKIGNEVGGVKLPGVGRDDGSKINTAAQAVDAINTEPQSIQTLHIARENDLRKITTSTRIPQWIGKDNPIIKRLTDRENKRTKDRSKDILGWMQNISDVLALKGDNDANFMRLAFALEGKKVVTAEKFKQIGDRKVPFTKDTTKTVPQYGLNDEHYDQLKKYLSGKGVPEDIITSYIQSRRTLDQALLTIVERMENMGNIEDDLIQQYRKDIGRIHNYFPHKRYGNWYAQVLNDKGELLYRRHFYAAGETTGKMQFRRLQGEMERELLEYHPDTDLSDPGLQWKIGRIKTVPEEAFTFPIPVDALQQILNSAVDRLPSEIAVKMDRSFAKDIFSILEANGATEEEIDGIKVKMEKAVNREQLRRIVSEETSNVLKSRGFGSHMIRRKGIPGFQRDNAGQILHDYFIGLSGWMSKMEAAKDYGKILGDIDAKKSPELYRYSTNYVHDMLENSSTFDRIIDNVRALFFLRYLGGNIKTAVVNLTQQVIAGAPRLGIDMGFIKANAAIAKAHKDIRLSVTSSKSIEGIMKRLPEDEAQLVWDMWQEGWGQDQLIKEVTGKIGSPYKRVYGKAIYIAGWPMQFAERFNRMALGLASYRTARDGKINNVDTLKALKVVEGQPLNYDQAKQFAEDIVNDAHFVYGKVNRPEMFRGSPTAKLLSTAYTFRTFTHNLLAMWRWMLTHNGKAGKMAFAESLATSAILGGLKSVVLYKTLTALGRQLFGEDWPEEWIRKAKGIPQTAKDMILYGAPAVFGVSIGGSLGMELPIADRIQTDKPLSAQVGSNLGEMLGIPWAMFEEGLDTIDAIRTGRGSKALEMFLPVAARNIVAAQRLKDEGQYSSTGRPINIPGEKGPRKITESEAWAKRIGFQPLSSSKSYDLYRTVEDLKNYKESAQSKFANLYMAADRRKDDKEKDRIRQEVREWNKHTRESGHPEYKIDLTDTIQRRKQNQKPPKQFRRRAKELTEQYGFK